MEGLVLIKNWELDRLIHLVFSDRARLRSLSGRDALSYRLLTTCSYCLLLTTYYLLFAHDDLLLTMNLTFYLLFICSHPIALRGRTGYPFQEVGQ